MGLMICGGGGKDLHPNRPPKQAYLTLGANLNPCVAVLQFSNSENNIMQSERRIVSINY